MKPARNPNFVGVAAVYDREIFVDSNTGKGYVDVLKRMKRFINWYAWKTKLTGFEQKDIKQLIIAYMLDGIRRFDPSLGAKLSTFLSTHVKNKMATRIEHDRYPDMPFEPLTVHVDDYRLDLFKLLRSEDDKTRRIVELVYGGYSITEAADEVGMTCWAASVRLKKLGAKKHVREFFVD